MQKSRIRLLCVTAMMSSLSIIIERLIVPTFQGQPFRVDFGNIPILMCGIACGPLWAGVCGALSDILGCYFNGYAPFIPLTLTPVIVGVLPAFALKSNATRRLYYAVLVCAYIVAEIFWTPLGLSLLRGTAYSAEFAVNLAAACVQTVTDPIIIYCIIKSRILERTGMISR